GTLEGKRQKPTYRELLDDPQLRFSGLYEDKCSDLYVTCQIFADGKALTLPTQTCYKAFTTRWNWNEWLTLPVKYSDLPRNAQAAFTIWDVYSPTEARPVGGTTVALFGKHGTYRQGMHDLKVWPNQEADGYASTKTPGKLVGDDTMAKLAKLTKQHHKGKMQKVDWLDRLTFRELEMINEKEKRESNFMFLMVEFARIHYNTIDFSIVYYEKDAEEVVTIRHHADIVTVPDPEMLMENLIEAKHHTLVRSERSGLTDRDLKPNAHTRDQLSHIIKFGPNKVLSSEEADLIWRFRFYLTNQKQALTKFLKSVKWDMVHEEIQALDLMRKWQPIDVADALELLSPQFKNPEVRRYAVSRLKQADDEELMLYLLQLVQALKYENFQEIKAGLDMQNKKRTESVSSQGERDRLPLPPTVAVYGSFPSPASEEEEEDEDEECDLATFLIQRACKNYTLANYFYWYLMVEKDDQSSISKDSQIKEMYNTVMQRFGQHLLKGAADYFRKHGLLKRQNVLINKLLEVMRSVAKESGNRKKKIERLQALLASTEFSKQMLSNFDPIPLPIQPEIRITGLIAEKASIFKSALLPCKLYFRTVDNKDYIVIAKTGDDLRQDQLILQMISLMDKLLQQENLDLKLTPYNVLATSSKTGFVQFVESTAVADVLSSEGSIQGWETVTWIIYSSPPKETSSMSTLVTSWVATPTLPTSDEAEQGDVGRDGRGQQRTVPRLHYALLHIIPASQKACKLYSDLFTLMVDANVPDIALEPDKTVKKLQDKFRLDLTDEEAVQYMKNLIDVSAGAMFAAWVEQVHKLAMYWKR
ncbi:phosphatidylinositol 3-kinase catalytic subunit type 3, partial [Apostichopus japonicus]